MHRALQTPPRDKGWIKGLLYNFAMPCQEDFLSVPYFQLYIEVPLLRGRGEPLDLQKTLYIYPSLEHIEKEVFHIPELTKATSLSAASNASLACLCRPRVVQHLALISKHPVHCLS